MKKENNENEALKNRKIVYLCKFSVVASFSLFLVSIAAQVYATNSAAIKSVDMGDLAGKREALARDVQRLELEISELSSLTYVEKEAAELGFVPLQENVRAIGPVPFASLNTPSL